ncbi:MAG: serine hydrolase [Flavobacteriales bacterium]|nr:serine hydrolase [Bacteroidales bacterium AH-315-I05]PCJ84457.1 MAG: serine hydrolase [Flavobacteriales bacterium]
MRFKKTYQKTNLIFALLVLSVFSTGFFNSQHDSLKNSNGNDTLAVEHQLQFPLEINNQNWVDSVFDSLTPDERIAQLFMVAAWSNKDQGHINEITKLVEEYKIGGLIFFQGGPVRQAKLTNHYQSKSKVPLLIAIDGEWGLAMRLDSTIKYPRQMMLGAIQDDDLIYQMGADIAKQCKRLGVHVNLAPVVDVNNNAKNPVINSRSFGEEKKNVARKSIAYMSGMQDNKVMATAKHFPGHGDTDSDSHYTLPVIRHTRQRLDNIELYPFRELIKKGIGSIMVAHLYIPALDSAKNTASTLSKSIVTDLLKKEMEFNGLVFTDALNMKGVSAYYKPGEVDLKALLAGNDVLLFAEDVPVAIEKIKQAIIDEKITQWEIDQRCKKILAAKQWAGLDNHQPIKLDSLYEVLNTPSLELTNRKLVESAITLLKNENNLVPLQRLDTLKIASVVIGAPSKNVFQKTLENYAAISHFIMSKSPKKAEVDTLLKNLGDYNLVIIGIHGTNNRPSKHFGITQQTVKLVRQIRQAGKKIILDVFANPYSLGKFYGAENADALLMSYEDSKLSNDYSAQLIFGGISANGKLSVTASPVFPVGSGIETGAPIRLKYTIPEEVYIKSELLESIDEMAVNGIKEHAYPGCQILVAKEGKIIYQKSFGHHTYEAKQKVKNDNIYDVASITKIAGTLPVVMQLQDKGQLNLDYNLCDYLPEMVDTTYYMNVNLREMLAHQAGLISWIPFYEKTMHKGEPRFDIYSLAQSELYPHRVAENFYVHKDYKKVMMNRILNTPLKNKGKYKYSDLGYYFLKETIEKITERPLEAYVRDTFYMKMGMPTTCYHPRECFELDRIVPTEYDLLFRRQLIHGDVHDPGAAMLGGVGGHAGVFSSANDLAKLMQLYLNWGEYGGVRYLKEETVKEFSRCQFCGNNNRRGAGFDKPAAHGSPGPTCDCISSNSFGHSGFTGTLAWADPDEEVVYIFLSNRVYPDANNRKLIKMGIRSEIMQVIYDAIRKSKEKEVN